MNKTYGIRVTRSGSWWAIEVTSGLPPNMIGFSQARRLGDVRRVARELVGDLVGVYDDSIDFSIEYELPAEIAAAKRLFDEADLLDELARRESTNARSRAAAILLRLGLTMREAGELLGLSHQRVKQLADRAPDADTIDPIASLEAALNSLAPATTDDRSGKGAEAPLADTEGTTWQRKI